MVMPRELSGSCRAWPQALTRLCVTAAAVAAAHAAPHASAAANGGVPRGDLWVEAELQADALHVQAQALYTLRLYQGVGVHDLAFHGPESARAEIRALGEQVREVSLAGERYRVTERRYAVFPFASGALELAGGYVSLRRDGRTAASEQRIEAPALTLDVSPAPEGLQARAWLPARSLTLSESWQPELTELRAGQSLRRTIRIEAEGLAAGQIPPLNLDAEGASLHPEPPRLEEREKDGWIVGTREQTWLITPTRDGKLTLPPVQLQWWNSAAGASRQVTLPARTIAVAAPATDAASGTVAPAGPSPVSAPQPPRTATAVPMKTGLVTPVAFAIAALLTAALAVRHRRTATLRRFRRACRDNDPLAARALLLQWFREAGQPEAANLLAVSRHLGGTATCAELASLDRHLYGKQDTDWNGAPLLAALHAEHRGLRPGLLHRSGKTLPQPGSPNTPRPTPPA